MLTLPGQFVNTAGLTERGVVEPRANYFTTRLNREWRRGVSMVGGIVTSVHRDLDDPKSRAGLRSSPPGCYCRREGGSP